MESKPRITGPARVECRIESGGETHERAGKRDTMKLAEHLLSRFPVVTISRAAP